nr:hypothetical protein [Tanacetum cinerariifolium]
YGDLVQGNVTINRVYYVEGLNHNHFSVGQFCDADLEVAFRKSTCFIRDIQVCLMAKASPTQAWLWHRRLSHLNFDYINLLSKKDIVIVLPKLKYVKDQLCSSCELSAKAERTRMIVESIHILFDEIKEENGTSIANNTLCLVPQRQKASDYDNSEPVLQRQDVSSLADANVPSQQELDLLFGPLYDEFFNEGSNPQDKQPSTNTPSTSAPSTPTNV